MSLPDPFRRAGISVGHTWEPGDLGWLIYLHGLQNSQDYGFNAVHEAYCASIAVEFILNAAKDRSRAWIARKNGKTIGSVLIVERPGNEAQLRLLFVDKSVRGIGLGRWLVEESVRYCAACRFKKIYLWTVAGLDRAISIYESIGFTRLKELRTEDWGKVSTEIRFDLDLELSQE